jgi:hypothetical protein
MTPSVTYASVRVPWKLIGIAGVAGVAATGVVVARKRRAHHDYDADELRERLHRRLAEVEEDRPPEAPSDASAG